MSKLKSLKKIINPRFLYILPLASTGLFCTNQSTKAMFNPKNSNPRINYFYSTETRRPISSSNITSNKTTIPSIPNINTKPHSTISPSLNTGSKLGILPKPPTTDTKPSLGLHLYTKYFFTPYTDPKPTAPKTPSIDTKPKVTSTPKPLNLGAKPKTIIYKSPTSNNKPKIDIKPVTYVNTDLKANLKSQSKKEEKIPEYIFKTSSPTKPQNKYPTPKWTHKINDRIDVAPDLDKGNYTSKNLKFLDMLKSKFPISQNNNPTANKQKTSSNLKEPKNASNTTILRGEETKSNTSPKYTSPSQKTIKKASDKFGEKVKNLSSNTLKNELKNQNKVDNPPLEETLKFKTTVGKLGKDTLRKQIEKHIATTTLKEDEKIEEASKNFGNLIGDIASANLELYLENNGQKGKSSDKIKSLSNNFGKSIGSIASKELSIRLSNLDEILR